MKQNNTKRLLSGFLIFGLLLSSWSGVLPVFAEEATVPSPIDTVQNQEQSTAPELMVADQVTPDPVSQSLMSLAAEVADNSTQTPNKPNAPRIRPTGDSAPKIGDTVVSGTGLVSKRNREKFNLPAKIYVTVKDSTGIVEEQVFTAPVDYTGSRWTVTLTNPLKKGDKIEAYQEFGDSNTSDPTIFEVPETLADKFLGKLTMPPLEVWVENTLSVHTEEDAVEDIVKAFKDHNKDVMVDDKHFEENLYRSNPIKPTNTGDKIEVRFSDGSKLEVNADQLEVHKITDYSGLPIIDKLKITDSKITGKISGNGPFDRVRVKLFINDFGREGPEEFCKDKGCIDRTKGTSKEVKVDPGTGTFSYEVGDNTLQFGNFVGVSVKEYRKFPNCNKRLPELVIPELTSVRDPEKLTDEEKQKIADAIRKANTTTGGVSKLPDYRDPWAGGKLIPAFIEFHQDGEVRIINPTDVKVSYPIPGGDAVYKKDPDGHYILKPEAKNRIESAKKKIEDATKKVTEAEEALAEAERNHTGIEDAKKALEKAKEEKQAIDDTTVAEHKIANNKLIQNLAPEKPTIAHEGNNITITPDARDTDAKSISVTYTDPTGTEKTLTATKNDHENWSVPENSDGTVDSNGVITLPVNKIKPGTTIEAVVTDYGYAKAVDENNRESKTSQNNTLKIEADQATQVKDLGGLDPVDLKVWVGDDLTDKWKNGVKAKDGLSEENKEKIKALLKDATITSTRTSNAAGTFSGTIKVTFSDDSVLEVENQNLIVYNHVISKNTPNPPDGAIKIQFKLGEGVKVNNADGNVVKEGKKGEEPVLYEEYWAKPGTNLETYTLPAPLNKKVFELIPEVASEGYVDPVWNSQNQDEQTKFVVSQTNKVFIATATKAKQVTLEPNGGIVPQNTKTSEWVRPNGSYKLPPANTFNPPNENQEFEGWLVGDSPELQQPGTEIEINGDTVVKAKWKPIKHQVSFNPGDGATGTRNSEKVNHGDEYTLPQPDTFTPPANQEFEGWLVGNDPVPKQPGTKIEITSDTLVTAKWKQTELTVTFKPGEGATGNMADQKVKKGNTYKLPDSTFTAPANKAFAGWKIEGSQDTKNVGDEITNVKKNLTLIAQWQPIQHQVTFDPNSGSGTKNPETVNQGDKYKLPPADTFTPPANQEFEGWLVGDSPELQQPGTEIEINGDTVVKAKWKTTTPNPQPPQENVTITFVPGEGSGNMASKTVEKGKPYKLPESTFNAPDGKIFAGWGIGDTGEIKQAGDSITVTENTTLTATWQDKPSQPSQPTMAEKVTALGGLDPVDLKVWVGDAIEWKNGVKVKMSLPAEKQDQIKALLQGAIITDESGRTSAQVGKYEGKLKVKFTDGSELVVDKQNLMVCNHVTAPTDPFLPDDAIEVTLQLGGGVRTEQVQPDGSIKITKKGDKDNPQTIRTLKVKPGTDLSTYTDGQLNNQTVFKSIGAKSDNSQYTPVWDGLDLANPSNYKVSKTNNVFRASAGARVNVTLKVGDNVTKPSDEITNSVALGKFKLPNNPFQTPANQTFKGWKIKDSQDDSIKKAGTEIPVDGDITLIAQWKPTTPTPQPPQEEKVSIIFNAGDKNATGSMPKQEIKQGEQYKLPESSFKVAGKTFKGWKVSGISETKQPGDKITVTENVTVTATWKPDSTTPVPQPPQENVKISFQANGGQGSMPDASVEKGNSYKLPSPKFTAPVGKEFAGWKIEGEDGVKAVGDELTNVQGNVTLVAQWKDKPSSSGGGSGYVPGGKSQPSKPDTKKPNATTPNTKTPDKTKVEPPKVEKDKDGNTTITPNTNGNGVKVVGKDKNGQPVEIEVKKDKDGKWYPNKPGLVSVDPKTGKITVGKGIKDLAISSMVEMERGIHHKYLYGYPDRTVRPEKFITRAEAAALIARLAKLDMSDKRKPQFKDTPSMWYNSAINIVAKKNLMLVEHGKFRPGEPITRAEFARALYYIDFKNDKIAPFADVKGHKFEQAINQAYGNDRIGGYPDGTFKPDAYIKRAEAAKMLNRFTKRGVNAEGLAGVKNQLAYFTDLRETYWGYYEIVEAANSHEYERPSNTRAETWLKVLKK